jgi:hypothetical protein
MSTSLGGGALPAGTIGRLEVDRGQCVQFEHAGLAVGKIVKQDPGDLDAVILCTASDMAAGALIRDNGGSPQTCAVQQSGQTPDVFSGLTVGQDYYAAASGGLATTGAHKVGRSVSDKALLLDLELLAGAYGGNGVDALAELTDVSLASPVAGQALAYGSGVWANRVTPPRLDLYPDYPGGVWHTVPTAGALTRVYAGTGGRTYLEWASTDATQRIAKCAIRVRVPDGFYAWPTGAIDVLYWTTDAVADAGVQLAVYRGATQKASMNWATTNGAWVMQTFTATNLGSGWVGGDELTLELELRAKNDAADRRARVAEIAVHWCAAA